MDISPPPPASSTAPPTLWSPGGVAWWGELPELPAASVPPIKIHSHRQPRLVPRVLASPFGIRGSQSQIAAPVKIPQGPNGSPEPPQTFLIFNNLAGLISGVYFERAKNEGGGWKGSEMIRRLPTDIKTHTNN